MQTAITEMQSVANPSGQVPSDNYRWRFAKNGSIIDTQTTLGTGPVTFSTTGPGTYTAQVGRLSDSGNLLYTEATSNTVSIPFPNFDVPKTVTLSL